MKQFLVILDFLKFHLFRYFILDLYFSCLTSFRHFECTHLVFDLVKFQYFWFQYSDLFSFRNCWVHQRMWKFCLRNHFWIVAVNLNRFLKFVNREMKESRFMLLLVSLWVRWFLFSFDQAVVFTQFWNFWVEFLFFLFLFLCLCHFILHFHFDGNHNFY